MEFQERTYRHLVQVDRLSGFRVIVQETDLMVYSRRDLSEMVRESILEHRGYLEAYLRQHPDFRTAMVPWRMAGPAPGILQDMVQAARIAGVGPMAAVAGAIAGRVGSDLLERTEEIIVENGGDVFIKADRPVTVGIYTGHAGPGIAFGIRIDSIDHPVAVCTSSGKIGHSISFGNAEAVSVVSRSCALADAVATSLGNRVRTKSDIRPAIETGKAIDGVDGLVVVAEGRLGVWGRLELVPLSGKKG
jgi:ApbE superfamily uncharacterized protein (UPF0280 family)